MILLAWLVHLYTASGLVLALLATLAVLDHDYRTAFLWLAVQVIVDATDGLFARAVGVKERIPWFNGAKLDDVVDYLTYVFVPALFVWESQIVPPRLALAIASAMLLASGYCFNRDDAKTADHFFTGFPSYWNIVVLYLWIAAWPPRVNAAILIALIVLVFVPVKYIYPSRMPVWRLPTNVLGAVWGALILTMLWEYPAVSRPVYLASWIYPVYYLVVSMICHGRTMKVRPADVGIGKAH